MKNQLKKRKDDALTVNEHLQELRVRILSYLLVVCGASVFGYSIHTHVINLLTSPLQQKLYYTNPVGGLQFVIQVSLCIGFIITIPFLLYQGYKFIEPVISANSVRHIIAILFSSIFLVILGMAVAYIFIIPATLSFLSSFGTEQITPLISVDAYFSFISWYLGGFALLFQLPIIVVILHSFFNIQVSDFLAVQKHVIVGCFILSAVITPTPDIINLLLFALPLLALYYFSLGILVILGFIQKRT